MNEQLNENSPSIFPIPVMPTKPMLAFAYVPYQYTITILSPMEGLAAGTIFPDLIQPTYPKQDICEED